MSNSPVLLYLSVIVATCAMAAMSEKYIKAAHQKSIRKFFFYAALLIPAIFITFTDTGSDYYSYHAIIENRHHLNDLVDAVNTEPLFTLWATIGWSVFGDAHLVIWSMKMGSLMMVFFSFYMLREKIDLLLAVMAYMTIVYLMSFYLISITIAACLICLAVSTIITGRFYRGLLLTLLACGFHYSSALAVVPILAYKFVFFNDEARKISKFRLLVVTIVVGVSVYSFSQIAISLANSYEQLEHYNKYLESVNGDSNKGFGILQILFYLPLVYILLRMSDKQYSRSLYLFFLLFTVFGFVSAELGYIIPILIRSFFIFIPVFCIFIPYYVCGLRHFKRMSDGVFSWMQIRMIAILYFAIRLYFTVSEHVIQGATSDLYEYHFFNPFE